MKKIGITGNIAAGKSAVEKIIADFGYKVIDADTICHNLLEFDSSVIQKVTDIFSVDIIGKNGKLDRKIIAQFVFSDFELKKKLENILHPAVKSEIEMFFSDNFSEKLVFASAALLFEANMADCFDKIILVVADDEIRLKRLMSRNNYTKDEAQTRLNAQNPQDEKIKLADFVINNSGTIEELKFNVKNVLNFLH